MTEPAKEALAAARRAHSAIGNAPVSPVRDVRNAKGTARNDPDGDPDPIVYVGRF